MRNKPKTHRPSTHSDEYEEPELTPAEAAARADALADAEMGARDGEPLQQFVDRIWSDHGHWPNIYFPDGLAGLCYDGPVPLPSYDPRHDRIKNAPKQADGTVAGYYYCTPDELAAIGIDAPPPRRCRHDGWTTARIEAFLEELRASGSITDACQLVGLTRASAYRLYAQPDSAHIRKAWDEALRAATNVLVTTAFDRAVNGVREQVWHQGKMVGFREKFDNRHLQFMLRARDPLNWAPLDDLQGWVRHRGLPEPPWPADKALAEKALADMREGEQAWTKILPGEGDCPPDTMLPQPVLGNEAKEPQALPGARDKNGNERR